MTPRLRIDAIIEHVVEEAGKDQRVGNSHTITVHEIVLQVLGRKDVSRSLRKFSGGLFEWELVIGRYIATRARQTLRGQYDFGSIRRWASQPGDGYRLTALLTVGELDLLSKTYGRRAATFEQRKIDYRKIVDVCRAAGLADTDAVTEVYDGLAQGG